MHGDPAEVPRVGLGGGDCGGGAAGDAGPAQLVTVLLVGWHVVATGMAQGLGYKRALVPRHGAVGLPTRQGPDWHSMAWGHALQGARCPLQFLLPLPHATSSLGN